MRRSSARKIALWLLLFLSLIALVRLLPNLTAPHVIPADDFVRFWAGAKLLLSGSNPYDPANINRFEIEAGSQDTEPEVTSIVLNPPWALSILLPFGLSSYPLSRLIWLFLSIGLIVFCTAQLWRFYQGQTQQKWLAWVAVFIFAPTISVLEKGQITPLLLLSLVGFLYFTKYKHNDLAAGAFLALASIKPQVIYIFWIALLFWVIMNSRWLILVGAGAAIIFLTAVTMIFDPLVIQQYLYAMQTYQTSEWATPTFGSYLRFFWLGTASIWLQFLPGIIGISWFLYYWYKHAPSWDWVATLPLLLLVSILTSPYAWTYDYVILTPAVIQAEVWLLSGRRRWSTMLLIVFFIVISVLDLGLHMRLNDFWFIWLAPALLIWFLLANKNSWVPKVEVST